MTMENVKSLGKTSSRIKSAEKCFIFTTFVPIITNHRRLHKWEFEFVFGPHMVTTLEYHSTLGSVEQLYTSLDSSWSPKV
jgi:hypothetical protein